MARDTTGTARRSADILLGTLGGFLKGQQASQQRQAALEQELQNRQIQDIKLATDILKVRAPAQARQREEAGRQERAGAGLAESKRQFEVTEKRRVSEAAKERALKRELGQLRAEANQQQIDRTTDSIIKNSMRDIQKQGTAATKRERGQIAVGADLFALPQKIRSLHDEQIAIAGSDTPEGIELRQSKSAELIKAAREINQPFIEEIRELQGQLQTIPPGPQRTSLLNAIAGLNARRLARVQPIVDEAKAIDAAIEAIPVEKEKARFPKLREELPPFLSGG